MPMRGLLLAVLAVSAVCALALPLEITSEWQYPFERYVRDFQKQYSGPSEYVQRFRQYSERVAVIAAHNRDPTHTWRRAVNKFTDMADHERRAYLGFSLGKRLSQALEAEPAPELHVDVDVEALPKAVDWRTHSPPVITPVKDQGGCGSCWAHAATEEVEVAVAMAGLGLTPLSRQNMLDCTPNPNQCGGTGGCAGATAELGLGYVQQKGLASEEAYPYAGADQTCDESIPKSAKIGGFVVLPSNNYTAVVTAVATVGPLAITVAADSWFDYSSGVFTGCGADFDLNHGVQLVGYGTDSGMDYWIVRNSWSSSWGENGYIRIQKHSDGGNQWCGVDATPSDGTGCQGGPSQVTVCGSCGLWYDTCYATRGSVPAEMPMPEIAVA